MLSARQRCLASLLLAAPLLTPGCAPTPRDETVYRGVWVRTPTHRWFDPLTREQALARREYMAEHYDAEGRIHRREIFVFGERVIEESYEYHADGRRKRFEVVRSDGERRVFRYDEQGELIAE